MVKGKPCGTCPVRVECVIGKGCIIEAGSESRYGLIRKMVKEVIAEHAPIETSRVINFIHRFLDCFEYFGSNFSMERDKKYLMIYRSLIDLKEREPYFTIKDGWIRRR